MASPFKSLSQVKLNIKQIIDNLQQLNNCENHEPGIENLKTNTEHLLTQLENLPLERFKYNSKRRQRKKFGKDLKKLNQDSNSRSKIQNDAEVCSESINFPFSTEPKKLIHHFRTIKECKRFLQTFELLEQLHLSRGHSSSETYKFALKLSQLKSIWNCLLQDKLQEQTSTDVVVQQQWNEVLFGPPERTYFHNKLDLKNFIRKRQIWDSYIDSKFGSFIPIGWIVPHEENNEQWRSYLTTANI